MQFLLSCLFMVACFFQAPISNILYTATNTCLLVNEPPSIIACDSGFVRRYGQAGGNEECFYLIPDGSGNFFFAGKSGASSFIMQVDAAGNILQQRAYNFTNGNDFVANLMVDDEGFLIGSARDQVNSSTTNILFKINWQTGNLVWAKKIDNPGYIRLDRVFQHPNGNYLFCGMTTDAIDNYFIEVDKTTGNLQWQFVSDYGGNGDVFSGYFTTNNAIFMAGQGRLGDGLDEIRPTLTKFDLDGNMLWSRIHLRSPNQPSRLYNLDLFIENDTIVNCGRGSLTSDDLTSSGLLFYKTDLDGELIWAKSYTVVGGMNTAGFQVHPIPTGYIVQGTYNEGSTEARLFMARLDKSGGVVWAKQINTITTVSGITKPLTLIDDDMIVFAAQTTQFDSGQNNDILFGKISLDGQAGSADCPLVQDITLVASNIPNPYDGSLLPTVLSTNYPYFNSSYSPTDLALPVSDIANCECDEMLIDTCANGLPVNTTPDAVLQSILGACNGSGMDITVEICNTDSLTLPQFTPISFYSSDPTSTSATLLAIYSLPTAVASGSCMEFTGSVSLLPNQLIFAVVNDDGTTPTPFNLSADFPNTPTQECDFTNNIASFTVTYNPSTLDLGPDVDGGCTFQPTLLDAGGGFASYLWSDGSIIQTITAQQPGTYAVTVTDNCGATQTDHTTLTILAGPTVNIGYDSVEVCQGESFSFSVNGFQSYQWFPANLVDCPTCPYVTISPPTNVCISVIATDGNGCLSTDTVCIAIVTDTANVYQNQMICEGDSIVFFGENIAQPGTYFAIDTTGICVETTHLTLSFFEKTVLSFTTETACPLLFNGSVTVIPEGGIPPYTYAWEGNTVFSSQLTGLDVGIYSVTVTDANGCAVVDSVELMAAARPLVSSEVQDVSCFGLNDGTVTFLTNDATLRISFLESPPSSQASYDSLFSGGYQYFVIDTFGCQWVQFFLIEAPDKIKIELPSSIEAEPCDSVQIKASPNTSPITYIWSPPDHLSCIDCPSPTASPFASTTYYLTVADSNGCSAVDSIRVRVDFNSRTYIPNAFSPDGNGINDEFYVLAHCVEEVRLLRIFDRWGEIVFEASNAPPNDPLHGWNGKFRGKDMDTGVFIYYAIVTLRDGSELVYQGDLTLLR